MAGSNHDPAHPDDHETSQIDRLDFDANRNRKHGTIRSHASRDTGRSLLDEDVDFMDEVAEGMLERDRQRMRREVMRSLSFVCAVLSW
jgi:hypothetical protein